MTAEAVGGAAEREDTFVLDGKVPRRARGTFRVHKTDQARVGTIDYVLDGEVLTLNLRDSSEGEPEQRQYTRFVEGVDSDEQVTASNGAAVSAELNKLTGLPLTPQKSG